MQDLSGRVIMPWDQIVYLPSYREVTAAERQIVLYALKFARAAMYRPETEYDPEGV